MCHDARELDEATSNYNAAVVDLEDLLDEFVSADKRRKRLRPKKVTPWQFNSHALPLSLLLLKYISYNNSAL